MAVVVIGIDIGVSGAIAAVDARGTCAVHDLPTTELAGTKRLVKREVDARALMLLVRELIRPGEAGIAVFEDVHMRPGNGGAATASLLHSRGVVQAVLSIARIEAHAVQPATWKRWYALLRSDKGQSLEKARTLYPLAAPQLKRQKDHNRAEALLIAHYGQRVIA